MADGLSAAQQAVGLSDDDTALRAIGDAIAHDREIVTKRLSTYIEDDIFRDAVFVASPSLHRELKRWGVDSASKKGRRLEQSVMKYFMRMASRCTPFGLFSGVSVGTIGDATKIELAERASYKRHTRLDMDFLTALGDALSLDPEIRDTAALKTNTSIYRIGERLRYAEARYSGRQRNYFLVDAENDEFLQATLQRARHGALRSDLAAALVNDEITSEEAEAYVDELIDAQLLQPDIAPTITGDEAITDLITQLQPLPSAKQAHDTLIGVRQAIENIDARGLGVASEDYLSIANSLEGLPADADIAKLFQVDMTKPVRHATLSSATIDNLLESLQLLHAMFGPIETTAVADFTKNFRERYEDRELPLAEVLDEENGIGFMRSNDIDADASPLLQGLHFPSRGGEQPTQWTRRDTFILQKLIETLSNAKGELVISDEDAKMIGEPGGLPLPDAFDVSCRLIGSADPTVDSAQTALLTGCSGPSGARLLGRFCQADAELQRRVENHLRAEEAANPGVVFFEIVHHPQGRVGNILARPVLREYELVYLGRSGASPSKQIDINDLLVSLQGNRVVLRSKTLGREVIPRLTTAHNTSFGALGIYRFLATLQYQGICAGLSWQWGAMAGLPTLPRVRYKNVVLSVRTWNVPLAEIKRIAGADADKNFVEIQRWKTERRIDRVVGLVDGDNVLTVDFHNPLSVDAFTTLVRDRGSIKLKEVARGDDLVATGPEGAFQNELIIPFERKPSETAQPETRNGRARGSEESRVSRVLTPGAGCVFLKIYTGTTTADRVLAEAVGPLAHQLADEGVIDNWFFIRYSDPYLHLRVRFFGDADTIDSIILPRINKALQSMIDKREIWKVQVDTYDRELHRYGGAVGVELCERIFRCDSEAVISLLGAYSGDEFSDNRWQLTAKGMDLLLSDMGFDLKAKHGILTRVSESFSNEFGIAGPFRKAVLKKYRGNRQTLSQLIGSDGGEHPLAAGIEILETRGVQQRELFAELKREEENGNLSLNLEEIAPSLLHMHANRALRSAQRAQESLIYNFLVREYDSQLARARPKRPHK